MASAIRTRSRRNGLSQNNNDIGDVANHHIIHTSSSSPKNANKRSNRRKHGRETPEEFDELMIEAKRAKFDVKRSPVRSTNQIRNPSTRNGLDVSDSTEPFQPRKILHKHESLHPDSPNPTKNLTEINGINGKRERPNISYSDKQVIAQSATGSNSDGKRKLRSEEGAHYKSELSAYFNEYDEVIGNVTKESQLLNAETQITLVDEGKSKRTASSTPSMHRALSSPSKSKAAASPTKGIQGDSYVPTTPRDYPDSLFSDLHDTKQFDLGFHLHKLPPSTDPLPDSLYEPAHRRFTRAEKSVRNQDKDRAQHEKDRVMQLLNGLKGHDWLKVLGVTGITEGKKKDFESARAYFIAGCENILERFRLWKEEEKKRKLEKDMVHTEPLEEDEAEDDVSDGDPPDYSDVDASAARQLHDEAIARMTPATPRPPVDLSRPPGAEFTSFFDKPRVREASLRKHRRSTRSEIQAFGQPIPEVEERDFTLDEHIITEGEAIRRERSGRTTRKTRRSGDNF